MYKSTEIAERIKLTAKKNNISVKQMLVDINMGFNAMSNMKTSFPKVDNLAKIADYLDVSVDYLLGRTTKEKVYQTVIGHDYIGHDNIITNSHVSDDDRQILDIYHKLTVLQKSEFLAFIGKLENKD